MASADPESPSALARERGNKLYREGKLSEAEKAYKEAAKLAPDDPSPLSNLSAVVFEKGDYVGSLLYLKKAIALSASEPDDSPKKRRLLGRAVKCHIHALNLKEAGHALDALEASGSDEAADLRKDFAQMEALWSSAPDVKLQRKLVLDRLPRYTPDLLDEPEYYAAGHDQPEPLADMDSANNVSTETDVRLMFCGSGDARNIFTTMSAYCLFGQFSNSKPKIHITMLDLKPAALARTIIMLDMAQSFAMMKIMKTQGHEHALVNMSYLYSSPFLPPFVMAKLRLQLPPLIKALEEGSELFNFAYVPPDTRSRVLTILKQWNQPLPLHFRSRWTRVGARRAMQGGPPPRGLGGKLDADAKTYKDLLAVFASDDYISQREPALTPLLEAYKKEKSGARDELENYLAATWTPNPTFVDVGWEEVRAGAFDPTPGYPCSGSEEEKADWLAKNSPSPWYEPNPVETASALGSGVPAKASEWEGAIDALSTFFSTLALSLIQLGPRITVEMIAGEMCDVMERLRHGVLEHRRLPPAGDKEPDPREFPSSYDRIHMSNVPDYVGGLFTVALHARPLLREDKPSNLRYNVLLNPPVFETHERFQAEYLLMPDARQIKANFALERRPPHDAERVRELTAQGYPIFMVDGYIIWERVATPSSRWPPSLARGTLERFMHAHFLKVVLPHKRPAESMAPVRAPLNLTALLRLAEHMGSRSGAGCPPHWVSGVLAAWCSGTIGGATARAPRQLVVKPESATMVHARRDVCVAPWRAELTTLVGIWRRLLPFGVLTTAAGKGGKPGDDGSHQSMPPQLEQIRRYRVRLGGLPFPHGQRDCQFALVFWNVAGNGAKTPPTDLRKLLLDDEEGDMSAAASKIRGSGVHIVTVLELTHRTATARFWLRGDVVEEMRAAGDWRVFVWRTSTWEKASDGTRVADMVDEGGWLDARDD